MSDLEHLLDYQQLRALLQEGQLAVVDRACAQRLEHHPEDAEALHLRGLAALLEGNWSVAIQHLAAAVALNPQESRYQSNLGEAQRRSGDLEAALESCQGAVALQPDYREARINLGCCLFALKCYDEALQAFNRVLNVNPNDARTLAYRADAQRELGRLRQARRDYERALELNEGLAVAHANLGPLLMSLGELETSLSHCRRAVELAPEQGFGYLNLGRCLVALDQLDEAMDAYAEAYRRIPDSAQLCVNIAQVWLTVSDHTQAGLWFQHALAVEPEHLEARCGLAATLREDGHTEQALAELEVLREQHPESVPVLLELARTQWDEGDAEAALEHYRRVAELRPQLAYVHANIGQVLASSGAVDEAVISHRRALEINPRCVPALNGLATTLRGKLPIKEVTAISTLLEHSQLRDGALASLHNGLAHYFDSTQDYEQAAHHVLEANALQWRHRHKRDWSYEPAAHRRQVDSLMAIFNEAYFQRVADLGVRDETPVFIIGMPRSGTTLSEQILASHPQVYGVGERDFAGRSLHGLPAVLGRSDKPLACLDALTVPVVEVLAEQHLQHLKALAVRGAKPDALRIVDKMPDNYHLLGWILTVFPRARIIHCRRDVRDVALSCWMTMFAQIPWACQLEHLAERIIDYLRLMDHWRRVLPTSIYELDYEALVADQERESRRLVEFLGLAWDPACLNYHDNNRLVRTASITQVRQPIYRRSVARWKPYEAALAPLLERLEVAGASPAGDKAL